MSTSSMGIKPGCKSRGSASVRHSLHRGRLGSRSVPFESNARDKREPDNLVSICFFSWNWSRCRSRKHRTTLTCRKRAEGPLPSPCRDCASDIRRRQRARRRHREGKEPTTSNHVLRGAPGARCWSLKVALQICVRLPLRSGTFPGLFFGWADRRRMRPSDGSHALDTAGSGIEQLGVHVLEARHPNLHEAAGPNGRQRQRPCPLDCGEERS